MKKIGSFQDINTIITNKMDVKDNRGVKVPFVNFLSLSLLEIVKIINGRDWTFQAES